MTKKESFMKENESNYSDFANVESQRNDLIPEEFAEGPFGSSLKSETLGKSTPWRKDQRPPNPFDYEYRELHSGKERHYAGDSGQGDAAIETFHEPDGEK